MKKSIAIGLPLVLALCLLASCGPKTPAEPTSASADAPAEKVTLLLAAAASLEASFRDELIPLFVKDHPHIAVDGTYDSSGKLQTQIEEGLNASVFMSAATTQMNALVDQGKIDRSDVVDLLENELVLITGVNTETAVTSFANIADAETIAIGDPASVPAGQYAEAALTHLGVWTEVEGKASLATNVTEVLNQVAEGSAEAGIVYATDAARLADKVKVLEAAPEGSLDKVIYPVAVLKDAPDRDAADAFVAFLKSQPAIDIFVKNGFKSNLP